MRRSASSEHLGSALTDLVTSLMVIFILLLLVFLNNRAGRQAIVTRDLLKSLQARMQSPAGTPAEEPQAEIRRDERDPGTLLFIVPGRLLNFPLNQSRLSPEGAAFLKRTIPRLAAVLGEDRFRPHIDTLVVEGHTDRNRPPHLSPSEGEAWNLRLSQDRSMEVVKHCLAVLEDQPGLRSFFMDKLSAAGRGESEPVHPGASDEENRRVVFKIRVKSEMVRRELSQALTGLRGAH
nr:OmpA family protein [uncultured Holophaga sp.]